MRTDKSYLPLLRGRVDVVGKEAAAALDERTLGVGSAVSWAVCSGIGSDVSSRAESDILDETTLGCFPVGSDSDDSMGSRAFPICSFFCSSDILSSSAIASWMAFSSWLFILRPLKIRKKRRILGDCQGKSRVFIKMTIPTIHSQVSYSKKISSQPWHTLNCTSSSLVNKRTFSEF